MNANHYRIDDSDSRPLVSISGWALGKSSQENKISDRAVRMSADDDAISAPKISRKRPPERHSTSQTMLSSDLVVVRPTFPPRFPPLAAIPSRVSADVSPPVL